MLVQIVGCGYVGVVTGACLAELGHVVALHDVDQEKLRSLSVGLVPFSELGLSELFKKHVLFGAISCRDARQEADIALVCVGTPPAIEGNLDTGAVFDAARWLHEGMRQGCPIAVKSTVTPGTCAALQGELGPERPVASNPEFLSEGQAIRDFFDPQQRVVFGGHEWAVRALEKLYFRLERDYHLKIAALSSSASAEMCKLVSNLALAARVSLANEVASVCERLPGGDAWEVMSAVGMDPRIGPQFLKPGPGYGGSCFPKDVAAFSALAEVLLDVSAPFSRAVAAVNRSRREILADLASEGLQPYDLVTVWGTAFKSGTDDTRESPSLYLVRELNQRGFRVVCHDSLVESIRFDGMDDEDVALDCDSPEYSCRGARKLVVMTDDSAYSMIDWRVVAAKLEPGATVIDARGVVSRARAEAAGLRVVKLGAEIPR